MYLSVYYDFPYRIRNKFWDYAMSSDSKQTKKSFFIQSWHNKIIHAVFPSKINRRGNGDPSFKKLFGREIFRLLFLARSWSFTDSDKWVSMIHSDPTRNPALQTVSPESAVHPFCKGQEEERSGVLNAKLPLLRSWTDDIIRFRDRWRSGSFEVSLLRFIMAIVLMLCRTPRASLIHGLGWTREEPSALGPYYPSAAKENLWLLPGEGLECFKCVPENLFV